MFSHQPQDYVCPFCSYLAGNPSKYNRPQDIIYQNDHATAFIAPKWWTNNPGHVLVIPRRHSENLYDIPDEDLAEVYKAVKKVAVAIRSTYDCDGTSTRQHNEPAGHQDVWHFHVHVFPRYENDKLYQNHDQKTFIESHLKDPYIEKLKTYFKFHPDQ